MDTLALAAAAIVLMAATPAIAQSSNPNRYDSQQKLNGGSTIRGFQGPGTLWPNNSDRLGNQNSVDGVGYHWHLDRNAGTHNSFGTGELRYGTGQNRQRYK